MSQLHPLPFPNGLVPSAADAFEQIRLAPRQGAPRLIAEALRQAIVDGRLTPGSPLRQDALARQFAVSAIPVREALRQLESEGWISFQPNKGAAVSSLSAAEALEIYEIRAALESLAIGLALERHTPESLARSAVLLKAAAREPDEALYVLRNQQFHLSLYQPAERPQLLELIGVLHRRGERYLRLKFGHPTFKGESDAEHAALFDAMRAGDRAAAQTLVTQHLLRTGELLQRFITDTGKTVPANSASEAASPLPRRAAVTRKASR